MNPLLRTSRLLPLLALAALGCGGHRSRVGGSTETTRLVFSASPGYNGESGDLTGEPYSGSDGVTFQAILERDGRQVAVQAPVADIRVGSRLQAGDAGLSFRYVEFSDDRTASREWRATSGGVTITKIQNGFADVEVDGLVFSPLVQSIQAGVDVTEPAAGTFQADGRIVHVPIGD